MSFGQCMAKAVDVANASATKRAFLTFPPWVMVAGSVPAYHAGYDENTGVAGGIPHAGDTDRYRQSGIRRRLAATSLRNRAAVGRGGVRRPGRTAGRFAPQRCRGSRADRRP